MTPRRVVTTLLATALLLGVVQQAHAITREEVMVRAHAIAYHPWRFTSDNATASCSAAYRSIYVPGDYLGVPYDWGGNVTLWEFDQGIEQGLGAGSYPEDDVLSCTVGLDCSKYVGQCWKYPGELGTWGIDENCPEISQAEMLPGDVFNKAGYHVVLYEQTLANGDPIFYEAAGLNVHINTFGGWGHVSGYTPRRYASITGTTVTDPPGTPTNPIVIGSLPANVSGNTATSMSDLLDRCGAASGTDESGPEVVYQIEVTHAGQLTASVSCDPGVDVDVHLYTSMNTSDCFARAHITLTEQVDCGTYYVVVDSFAGASNAGAYTLNLQLSPSGQPCGPGPEPYLFEGGPGDACAYAGNPNLPYCNENLGAAYCVSSSSDSFCSHPCATTADCGDIPGGCCQPLQGGELACYTPAYCGTTPPPDGGIVPPTDGGTPIVPDGAVIWPDGAVTWPDGAPVWPQEDAGGPGIDDGGLIGGDGGGGGGGCRTAGSAPATSGSLLLLGLAALVTVRRSRRR